METPSTSYRFIASLVVATFIANILAPTIQYTFAASTLYYVNATGGSDVNDGLSPATAWQTLGHVNVQVFSQGDSINLLCGESWTGQVLQIAQSGIFGTPITYASYNSGTCSAKPIVEKVQLNSVSNINVNNLAIISTSTGAALKINGTGANISVNANDISNTLDGCIELSNVTSTTLSNNTLTTCTYGLSGSNVGVTFSNNSISGMSKNAIQITDAINLGGINKTIQDNTFLNLVQGAIVFNGQTDVRMNNISNVCTGAFSGCAAIENASVPLGTLGSSTVTSNIIKNVGTGVSGNNAGIQITQLNNTTISFNTLNNAENALKIQDTSGTTINGNTLIFSRAQSLLMKQESSSAVRNNTFSSNILLQKNIDYPYIEIRDDIAGTGIVAIGGAVGSFISASANNFVTLYKPDTSYIRTVKFGGESVEYNKKSDILLFDLSATTFQSFGYKAYTNTGSYTTANLLTNPSFESDVTGWTASAMTGTAPSLSQKIGGSYSGNSLLITPLGITPDRMWISNDSTISLTSGQVYEVKGYLKSTQTGTLNIGVFMHQSGSISNLYSDRTIETFATSTGGIFQFYLSANTTAADGVLTFETSNQSIPLEMDEISIRGKNIVQKNTNVNEVLTFSNTGASTIFQACPGGVPCAQYVDTSNATIGWPTLTLAIPAYSTALALWNNSPNLITVPSVSMTIDSGSIPSGTLAHVSWNISNSTQSSISYTTSTGGFNQSISGTGDIYFEPPPGTTTTTYIYTQNEVGNRINQVDVTTTNTPPIVFPVTITGTEDNPLIVGTLSGYDQNPGDTTFFDRFVDPLNGTLSIDISGTASYTPNPNFCGNDTFQYRAYDQFSNYADPVTATFSVNCVNDPPVAVNDSYTETGLTLDINPMLNDTDVDSPYVVQTFSLSGFTQPIHGIVIQTGGILNYTPNSGYIGPDSFQYRIQDQSGAVSNTGNISITVAVPNTAPTDSGAVYVTAEDTPFSNTLSGSDINGDILSFTVSTLPIHGIVNIVGSTFTYTPTANYNGTDSFIYKVFDGSLYSTGASIDFTITPVPDPPVAVNDSFSPLQDTPLFLPVMNNDYDVDSASGLLSLTGFTNPTNGTISTTATGFLYTPNMSYFGADSFTYRLIDETALLSNIATVNLNVTSSNMPPVASGSTFSLNEDSVFTGSLPAYDPESATLTYRINTLPTQGVISVTSTGIFSYTPNANYNGSDSLTFHVNDGIVDSNIATINLTILPLNDPPVAYIKSYTIVGNSYASSGNVFAGTLSGTDIDSFILTYTAATIPIHGILSVANSGTYTYNPAYGYTGSDSFMYLINDEQGGISNTGVVNFTISVVNSAPFAATGSYITNEDTPISFTLSGSDPDGNTISYILDSSVTSGSLILLASGTVNFIPALNYNGTVNLSYHTSDGLLSSPVRTVSIDVLPVNDPPITTAGSATIIGNTLTDSGHTFVFPGRAMDVDSTVFSYSSTVLPTNGILTMNASGVFTYRPNIGYTGLDSFTYVSNDGLISGNPAIVTITISSSVVPGSISGGATAGPGGGGGGGGSSTSSTSAGEAFSSAPVRGVSPYQTINGTVFISNDPSGLTSQLMLMNRTMNASGLVRNSIGDSPSLGQTSENSIIGSLMPRLYSVDDAAVYLRTIVRYVLGEAAISEDPSTDIDKAVIQIKTIDTRGETRLILTKEYAIRILQFHQQMYEEMMNRDLNSAPSTPSRNQETSSDTSLDDIVSQLSI